MNEYINKIINADCLDILKQMPDKSIDLVLTDPPYGGCGENKKRGIFGGWFEKYHIDVKCKRTGGGSSKYQKGDNIITHWDFAPDKEVFDEIFRVSKNQIIWGVNKTEN